MSKKHAVLFFLRVIFYFSVITLIYLHPGITVTFDSIGIIQWFFIVPIQAVIAYLPLGNFKTPARGFKIRGICALGSLFVLSVLAGGFSPDALRPFAAGLVSFVLTYLLFHHPKWAKISALEPFLPAWVCLRLLALSRSGEDIAVQSESLTQFILVWTFAVFLFHSAVIYLCLFPQSIRKAWKEGIALVLAGFAVLVVVLVILPPDFVSNTVIENLLPERNPERIRSSDLDRGLPDRGSGRRTLPQGRGQRPELRGLSEHEWGTGLGGDAGDNRQYMVMLVASEVEPVYMGNSFRGQLDPIRGFLLSPHEQLNDIVNQRLFVTWSNTERNFDYRRRSLEVFSLSTLWQKYLPYFPVSADPVILSENTGPLRYIHQVVSSVHSGDPLELVNTPLRPLNERERTTLAPYLELTLEAGDMELFKTYLDNAVSAWEDNRQEIIQNDRYLQSVFNRGTINRAVNEHLEKIIAILAGFKTFQYNLNYDESYSINALKEFLFNYREGDCVEFSNTLALLGRLAGIPSRVVTGYLAAESLQTEAHLRGIAALQAQIPVLQQFPFENLFMVTNIHSHSWVQFYIPNYGWLDFESTSFAIPPMGMGDFNNWDVVIPLLDENRTFSQVRRFPWQAAGRTLLTLAIIAIIAAYILRYVRELTLYIAAKQGGRKGARSLYLLLLARLAADGQPIKPASKTAGEYSRLFADRENPHFKTFAEIYSQLRWRSFETQTEFDDRFTQLKKEYHNILNTTRKKGFHRLLLRLINLRGLAYL